MSDVFIKNGKADFTGPEFRELAEYVNDNVRETSKSLHLVDEEDMPRSEEDDPSPGRNKTAYEMNLCDWSSDVCSSDLGNPLGFSP